MKVTIKMIAEEAGVSMTTVTNVLKNRTDRVSKEKIELINDIIKKYNYTPNMNARSLANSSSNLIGLLYHSVGGRIDFSDPFVSELLAGIEEKTKDNGYFVLVYNIETVEDVIKVQKNWKFEGFIIVGLSENSFEEIHKNIPSDTPIVFVDTHLTADMEKEFITLPNRYIISSEDRQAGYEATKFLISQGHRKIGFLGFIFNENEPGVINERFQGFKKALQESSISFDYRFFFTDKEFEKITDVLEEITGLVVSSDYLAINLIHYLRMRGLYDKKKLSIIGFDDVSYAKFLDPPLTTIRLNQKNKGIIAFNLLNKAIHGETVDKITNLPGDLIVRESVTNVASKIGKQARRKNEE